MLLSASGHFSVKHSEESQGNMEEIETVCVTMPLPDDLDVLKCISSTQLVAFPLLKCI